MEMFPKSRLKLRVGLYLGLLLALYGVLRWCTTCLCVEPPFATTARPEVLEAPLKASVTHLATTIGERNAHMQPQALDRAGDWLIKQWNEQRLDVRVGTFEAWKHTCRNLEVDVTGPISGPVVVIGAHYDSASTCPGADDNASGVAALLEVTKALRGAPAKVGLRAVAFTNEEPPNFRTDTQGSRVYAKAAVERGERIAAMISLETIGWYDDRPGSQRYPAGLSHFYPSTGSFVGVAGNVASRPLVHRVTSLMRAASTSPSVHRDPLFGLQPNASGAVSPGSASELQRLMPVECISIWGRIPGVGWSDHEAFWEHGIEAVMVTDTAPFRNPRYHTAQDTADTLDYKRLARTTAALIDTIGRLIR